MFFFLNLFPSPETTATRFLFTPPNPSYVVEGMDFTLKWNYTLDGSLNAVGFFNITKTGYDLIGSRNGSGRIKIEQKYEARFRAQAKSTEAELTILAVQSSDEGTYKLMVVSSKSGAIISNRAKIIVHCKYNY